MSNYPEWTFCAKREAIKREIYEVLDDVAGNSETITYSDLVSRVRTFRLLPDDARLHRILEEISAEENAAGRGLLGVLVLERADADRPGLDFFELAQGLGREISNLYDPSARDRVFTSELDRVHAEHRRV